MMHAQPVPQLRFDLIEESVEVIRGRAEAWARDVLSIHVPPSAKIISFDGWDGAGKTTLARALSTAIRCLVVDLDDHLEKHQGVFLSALRAADLARAVDRALTEQGRVVIAGCLVEAALRQLSISADCRIYVMRVSAMISNADFEFIDEYDALCADSSADELIAKRDEDLRRWMSRDGRTVGADEAKVSHLERELIRYHKEGRPHELANLIVKVVRRF